MTKTQSKYFQATGRRKTAVAQVRITPKESGFLVNSKPLETYFSVAEHQRVSREPFLNAVSDTSFGVSAKVSGGGLSAQAEAIRLGVSRALLLWNPELRATLKRLGYLKRDPRMRERKKFGLRRARRAVQWRKR
ncbi:MAG: 30S ribosomal protein S9 [Candidatus Wildermuthbacteria bacterium]|nr:30S ribosomal protein S9 [Candidatus Wildermuthbacteria bacterium]